MNTDNITVVIPNWNGKDILKPCLDSLVTQSQKPTIIVVDNGSTDGSQEFIKNTYPNVQLIELDKNYGFTGGVNAGIKSAVNSGAKFVALLNNDTVVEHDWLENLYQKIKTGSEIGIVTSKILRDDRKHLDSTGDFYSIWGLPFPRGRNQVDEGQFDGSMDVFAASGGASLYREQMLEEIGLFDDEFFAYYEDVDLSFRAQLAGWKINYEPKARVYHRVNATSSKLGSFSRYHSVKNFFMLYAKNMPGWLYFKYLPLFTLQTARWCISSILRGGGIAYFKGMVRAFLNTPHIIRERRRIQKNRKVEPAAIDELLFKSRPPRIPNL